jgi:hypothetical protein
MICSDCFIDNVLPLAATFRLPATAAIDLNRDPFRSRYPRLEQHREAGESKTSLYALSPTTPMSIAALDP